MQYNSGISYTDKFGVNLQILVSCFQIIKLTLKIKLIVHYFPVNLPDLFFCRFFIFVLFARIFARTLPEFFTHFAFKKWGGGGTVIGPRMSPDVIQNTAESHIQEYGKNFHSDGIPAHSASCVTIGFEIPSRMWRVFRKFFISAGSA